MQNKQLFKKVIKESKYILILAVISIIALKILFFKESFAVILRLTLSFFWVFIIPGISVMFYWEDKLSFTERLIIGVGLSSAMIGISSYYIGLIGLNIRYHVFILPSVIIIAGIFISSRKKPSDHQPT
ncbi:MAG: hypothetical protein ABIH64_02080 [Nanoarchaeota archaeon]